MDLDTKQEIDSIVARCRQLKAEGRLHAGVEYFITDEFKVDARTLPPLVAGATLDIHLMMTKVSACANAIRHRLSNKFDTSSDEWNDSSIGQFIKFACEKLSQEANKDDGVYNIYSIHSLFDIFCSLSDLVNSLRFKWAFTGMKFRMLNRFAIEHAKKFHYIQAIITMSMIVELMIAIDELYKISPRKESVESLLLNIKDNAKACVAWFDA